METKKAFLSSKARRIALVVIAFALVAVFVWGSFASSNTISDCNAPEGYTFVSNVMASDLGENPIYIARAVIAMGEVSAGGKKVTIPACGSPDSSLQNISNMFVVIDGKLAFIANGAVGRGTDPLVVTQQP